MWSLSVPCIGWSLPLGMICTADRYVRLVRRLENRREGERLGDRRAERRDFPDRREERRDRVFAGDRRRGILN